MKTNDLRIVQLRLVSYVMQSTIQIQCSMFRGALHNHAITPPNPTITTTNQPHQGMVKAVMCSIPFTVIAVLNAIDMLF